MSDSEERKLDMLLVQLKEAEENDVRSKAAENLSVMTKFADKIVPVLIEALNDDNLFVRVEVVRSLGKLGWPAVEAIDSLKFCMKEPRNRTKRPVFFENIQILEKVKEAGPPKVEIVEEPTPAPEPIVPEPTPEPVVPEPVEEPIIPEPVEESVPESVTPEPVETVTEEPISEPALEPVVTEPSVPTVEATPEPIPVEEPVLVKTEEDKVEETHMERYMEEEVEDALEDAIEDVVDDSVDEDAIEDVAEDIAEEVIELGDEPVTPAQQPVAIIPKIAEEKVMEDVLEEAVEDALEDVIEEAVDSNVDEDVIEDVAEDIAEEVIELREEPQVEVSVVEETIVDTQISTPEPTIEEPVVPLTAPIVVEEEPSVEALIEEVEEIIEQEVIEQPIAPVVEPVVEEEPKGDVPLDQVLVFDKDEDKPKEEKKTLLTLQTDEQPTLKDIPTRKIERTILKVLLLGDRAVGKTALREGYCDVDFQQQYKDIIGADFATKYLEYDSKTIALQVCDLSGEHRMVTNYDFIFKGAKGVLLVFDVTNKESFDSVWSWYTRMKEVEKAEMVLVGNKIDLRVDGQEHISAEQGRAMADKLSEDSGSLVAYFETNALSKENVNDAFKTLADKAMAKLQL